ncbi:hypothetical protein HDU92_006688 [Lobulomyces angularis]|nr:hypothetical protein HDU92_006688 [Lobulomyces angularis]
MLLKLILLPLAVLGKKQKCSKPAYAQQLAPVKLELPGVTPHAFEPNPVYSSNENVYYGLPKRMQAPAAPRSAIVASYDEDDFKGSVVYNTAEDIQAVWLDNLEGLNDVDCSAEDQTLTLTFDTEEQATANFPDVWQLPFTALISPKYVSCIVQVDDDTRTLGLREIRSIKAVNQKQVVVEAQFLDFRGAILSQEFEFSSKPKVHQPTNNATLERRIEGSLDGNIPIHYNFDGGKIVEYKQSSIVCKKCNFDYDLGWEVKGGVTFNWVCTKKVLKICVWGKMDIDSWSAVNFNGQGGTNVDLDFRLSPDIKWSSAPMYLVRPVPIGPAITIPLVLDAGFFFSIETMVALKVDGDISLTTGFDVQFPKFTYSWDSRHGSNYEGSQMIANFHPPQFDLKATFTPSISINPLLSASINIAGYKNSIGLGLKNEFLLPITVATDAACHLEFMIQYQPDVVLTLDKDLTDFPLITLLDKICLWNRDLALPTSSATTDIASTTTTLPTTAIPTTALPTSELPTTSLATTALPTTALPTTALPTTHSSVETTQSTTEQLSSSVSSTTDANTSTETSASSTQAVSSDAVTTTSTTKYAPTASTTSTEKVLYQTAKRN